MPCLEPLGEDAPAALARLAAYADRVLTWNRSVSNLVSTADEPRIVTRHLLESLLPADWLRRSRARAWLDFGSGAGLPAVPLAIAGVGAAWTLVESRRPKALFLRKVVQELGLQGVTPIHSRLEKLVPTADGGSHDEEGDKQLIVREFDGFTSRATLRLDPTLELAAQFVRPGGLAFLWKGSGMRAELAEHERGSSAWRLVDEMVLGDAGAKVCKFELVAE